MRTESTSIRYCLLGMVLAACLLRAVRLDAREVKPETWRQSETLVSRLGAEWYKIGVLRRDLESIRDVLADLRNIEIFPEELSRLSERRIVALDRRIEALERQHERIGDDVEALRMPLSDAMAILREMVIDVPVEDMLEVLEDGDLARIEQMLAIKHDIDALWETVDSLTVALNAEMGFPPFETEEYKGLEKEFFEILRANLGKQSEEYYRKMSSTKDSLVARGNREQKEQAFVVEMHQIDEYMEQQRWEIARQRMESMLQRYTNATIVARIHAALAQVYFALGNYHSSLASAEALPSGSEFDSTRALFYAQSLYALQEHGRVWEWAKTFDFSTVSGRKRNMLLWITMESGFSLGKNIDYSRLAGHMVKTAPYQLHVMHALARSYLIKGESATGLSVLQSALLIAPATPVDERAYRKVLLATAQAHYEAGEYEKALKRYFQLLDEETDFEEALYGISWCYIRLRRFQKAEATLRKLINQNPASPLAAEAILLMARRYANKAQYEWKKATYLSREHERLRKLENKLSERLAAGETNVRTAKMQAALEEIRTLLSRIKSGSSADRNQIASQYDKGRDICELVNKHYETGSFQEITFSESREALLHVLDSLLLAVRGTGENTVQKRRSASTARKGIERIKGIVRQTTMLTAEIDIDRYRWEREYIDWQKTMLASEIKAITVDCREEGNRTVRGRCLEKKRGRVRAMDSLLVVEEQMKQQWHERLTERISGLLKTSLRPADEVYLRYHLGELFYERENATFAAQHDKYEKDMAVYQKQMAAFHDGTRVEMPPRPAPPRLNHERSMREYRMAIEKYPAVAEAAAVRYSLAWCFTDLGRFDSAIVHMTEVARTFPQSRYAPQAWMYLGESYFDASELDKAIEAYQSVMKYPKSEWFDEALYKLAWTHYRKSNPGKAISSFLALVDLGEGAADGKALLEKESMDYVAISFSESDPTGTKGLEQAAMFAEKIDDVDRGTQILHRLATVYKEQGRFDMSKATYRTLLQMFPNNPKTPLIESEFLGVLGRDMKLDEACTMKRAYFEKYNRDGEWAKAQRDPAAVATADSLAARHLYDAAVTRHQIALQGNEPALYKVAASNYEQYIRTYPRKPVANECHYNLAEILFSLGTYDRAAEEYIAVSKRYPDSKYRETAAWNAIVASQNLLKQEEKAQ